MRRSEMFPEMWRVVPEGETASGVAVEHFTVDRHAAQMTAFGGGRNYVPEGKYARLVVGRSTMMSDTAYERRTNRDVCEAARGRVLVAGYGLGMILTHILKKPEVAEVLVIEDNDDVVALVDPHVRRWVGKRAAAKLSVCHGDVWEVRPRLGGGKFDVLWFDIWAGMSTDQLPEMTRLLRLYRGLRADRASFMGCWDRDWLRYRREQERRAGW